MPASRRKEATTRLPRSWPSRPILVTSTFGGCAFIGKHLHQCHKVKCQSHRRNRFFCSRLFLMSFVSFVSFATFATFVSFVAKIFHRVVCASRSSLRKLRAMLRGELLPPSRNQCWVQLSAPRSSRRKVWRSVCGGSGSAA